LATITALPGTHDLFAPEIARWQDMEAAARRILGRACFSEIRTPVFERTQLFERGVGEATDVVEKQMYTFESRGGEMLALRPEGSRPPAPPFRYPADHHTDATGLCLTLVARWLINKISHRMIHRYEA